jgi:hypothetical protein
MPAARSLCLLQDLLASFTAMAGIKYVLKVQIRREMAEEAVPSATGSARRTVLGHTRVRDRGINSHILRFEMNRNLLWSNL